MGFLQILTVVIIFSPLVGSLFSGVCNYFLTRKVVAFISVTTVFISTIAGFFLFFRLYTQQVNFFEFTLYSWGFFGKIQFEIGFLVDRLTTLMFFIVTFISLMVHIYTIGYMAHDKGFKKFFCYISFFTFAMLMLVSSNNFLQLFFGWEAVGLASYLLIGFWFQKESATFANFKAFLVNRIGDFGFILGVAGIFGYFNSLNYLEVFKQVPSFANEYVFLSILPGIQWSVLSVICICLFIGAMGKSAQIPLHVWLPDSMEGPTPISALIHAATMVTAGIFMVTRMSPLFEYSNVILNFILIIGTCTCFFMGLLGIVESDIKRIIAYSTLSQLGLMVAALGVSSYALGMFHLMTHAFFKALLFLCAGSVIIGMHHKQNVLEMGNLRTYMPVTYFTMLIGSLSLVGVPGFSGFFSKDLILESIFYSTLPFSSVAYYVIYFSIFITAFYTFRLFFLVFHTKERTITSLKPHESPKVMCFPLIVLTIPSVCIGYVFVDDILGFYFADSIFLLSQHSSFIHLQHEFQSAFSMVMHGIFSGPCVLGYIGILLAWFLYSVKPSYVQVLTNKFMFIYVILKNGYWFDYINLNFVVKVVRKVGLYLYHGSDQFLIDGLLVNGSVYFISYLSQRVKKIQTGYLYHYVFVMLVGLFSFLLWLVLK